MRKVLDFVVSPVRCRKSTSKVKKTITAAYSDKALRMTSIYYVISR
jgi:hypothetical protein